MKQKVVSRVLSALLARLKVAVIAVGIALPGLGLIGAILAIGVPTVAAIGVVTAVAVNPDIDIPGVDTLAKGKPDGVFPAPGTYRLPELESVEESHSLNMLLGGKRIDALTISDVNAGKETGLTNVLEVSGLSVSGVQQYIYAGAVVIDNLHCKTLTLSNGAVATLTLTSNEADGNSFGPGSGSPTAIDVASSRGEDLTFSATGESYDKILVQADTGHAFVRTLTIKDVDTFGGACVIKHIKATSLTIQNSTIGAGTGINTPDFTIASTFVVGVLNSSGNLEKAISVR